MFVLGADGGLNEGAHPAHGAHGVVVSHPPRMRKALGSNPSVSILEQFEMPTVHNTTYG